MAEALYRKYRPQVFEDVVGQEHIERTIKNAIERDKVSHAYLFTGPRGTGKTTTARLLAKALLCQKGPTPEPDGTCEDCELIASGEHPDVYELDAASRTGVENVREEIIGRVQFAPTRGRYKIYIIDEVHMLSTAAFNALLKTLEEPPSHVVFILATTDPQKVPETIHSRCQRFDFRRISNEAIAARLGAICVAEGVEYEEDALDLIAHRAEGGLRNALTSLEQLIAFGEGSVSMEVAERMLGSLDSSDLAEIVRFVGTRDVAACFKWTADFVETGSDLAQFTRDFAEHVRNLYVLSLAGAEAALDVTAAARRELMQELPMFGPDRLARLLGVLGDLSAELKTSTNPRLSFEIALTRMVRPESDLTLEGLAARIEELEAKVREGVALVSGSPAAQVALPVQGSAASASGLGEAHLAVSAAHGLQAQAGSERPSNVGGSVARGVAAAAAAATSSGAGESTGASAQEPFAAGGQAVPAVASGRGVASGAAEPDALSALPASRVSPGASAQAPAQETAVRAAGSAGIPEHLAAQLGNPAALQRLWQSVLASLKKAKTAYGVLFLNTKALFDAASGTLIVDFPAENEFAFKAVQKPDIQDELGRCIVAACGVALPYTLQKGGAASAVGSAVGGVAAAMAVRAARPASSSSAGRAAADRAGVPDGAAAPHAGAQSAAFVQEGGFAESPRQAAGAHAAAQSATQAAAQAPGFGVSRASSQAVATPEPAVRQEAPAAAPEYDGPPLDAYDDYVPYGDDGYGSPADLPPWDEPAPRQPERAPAGGPSSGADLSVADLDAALAFGFGTGVTFTEV